MLSGLNFSTYGQKAKIEKVLVKQLQLLAGNIMTYLKSLFIKVYSVLE